MSTSKSTRAIRSINNEPSSYFIAYFLLFTAHTSSEPRSYRSEAFRHLYMQCLRDKFSHLSEAIKTRLSSLLLVAVACAGNAWGKPNHVKSSLQLLQCWSLDAVSLALADPTLTALEIPRVHAYIADRAPKTIDLTASMESAARLLLQSNATVCYICRNLPLWCSD